MFKRLFLSDRWVLFIILLNAVLIFFMAFPGKEFDPVMLALEYGFTIFFTIELLVKLREFGFKNYIKDPFNKIDFLAVVASIPVLITPFVVLPKFTFLMVLRLLRLLRITRLLRFIPNMNQLTKGLTRAFKASVFVLLALFLYNFLLAVLTCQLFHSVSPEYFGDPIISFYTIFQLFTTEGWNEISDSIAANTDDLYAGISRAYFMLIVLSGGIFGLSIANAVFVDEMTMDNNIELEKKIDNLNDKIDQLQHLLVDKNNNSDQ